MVSNEGDGEKEMIISVLVVFVIMYFILVNFAYFLFGSFFEKYYGVKIKYWSIYNLSFKMKK